MATAPASPWRYCCTQGVRALAVPLAAAVLVVATFSGLFETRSRFVSSGAAPSYTWLGPDALCQSWLTDVTGVDSSVVFSDVVTDAGGTEYFTDATPPSNASSLRSEYRLRKLSAGGARTFDVPHFAQLPASIRATAGGANNSTPGLNRLRVLSSVHEASQTLVSVQQGDINITALQPGAGVDFVHFAHISLRTSSNGGCLWGYSLTNAVNSAEGSDCDAIAAAGLDFDPLVMDVSQVVTPYAVSTGVAASASTCSSPVTVLGRAAADVILARFLLLFPCDSLNVPLRDASQLRAGVVPSVMSPLTRIALELPTDYSWQGRGTLPLLSVQSWPYVSSGRAWSSSADVGADAAYIITAFPVAPIAPWPTDAVIASSGIASMLSELVVYNTSTLQVAWSLSADLRASSQPVVAILSNVAVSPSGTMFFVAVRNVTSMPLPMRQWENSSYDVAVIAIDVNTANILWQSPIAPFNMMPIAPGVRLQLVQLSYSANALLFCAQAPDINVTVAGKESILSLPSSDFGIGAINTVGGELLWHDSTTYVYLPPDRVSRWVSTRPAYCASNLVTDEKHVFAVVARRTSLGDSSSVSAAYSVGLQYALYCRASVDGAVMWTTLLGAVPPLTDAMLLPQVFSSSPNAGDVLALIRPFALTFAAQRRLILKYDTNAVATLPAGAAPDATSIIRVQSFQCQVRYPTVVSWVLLGLALFISVLVVRVGGGWLSVCVRVHLKAARGERGRTDSATSLPPLAALPPVASDSLPVDDRAHLLGGRGDGDAPVTSSSAGRKRGRKSKRPSARRDAAASASSNARKSDESALSSGSRSSSTSRKKSSDSRRTSGSVSSHGRSTDKEGNFGYVTPLVTTTLSAGVRTSSLSRLVAGTDADASIAVQVGSSSSTTAAVVAASAGGFQASAAEAAATERPRLSSEDPVASAAPKREVLNDIDDYCTIGMDTLCSTGIQALLEVPPADDAVDAGSGSIKHGSFSGSIHARSPAGRFSFNEYVGPSRINASAPRASCVQRCSRCATALRPHVCPIPPGVPTTLLSLLHYVVILSLLSYGLSGARNSVALLDRELSNPLAFYNSYLINRSPQPGAACASDAAAACYCTDSDFVGSPAADLTVGQCNATYPALQRCDYDISACAVSCSTVLQATGNCAASVFEYQCYCDTDCTGTLFESNSTFRTAGAGGGLIMGLQACSDHYSTITTVLTTAYIASCILGAIAMAVTLHLHLALWQCTRAAPALAALTMDVMHKAAPGGDDATASASPTAGVRQTEPLLPAGTAASVTGLRVHVPEERQFVHGAFPRTPARSSRAASIAASLLTPSPITRSGVARAPDAREGGSGIAVTRLSGGIVPQAFASSAARRRYEAIHGSNPEYVGKSRAVGILIYLAVFQVGLFVGVFTWLYFLVIQGRFCTGADADGAGTSAPLVGNESPPENSLILRYVPGCAFGSTWQDTDLEGAALRSVWLAIAAQVVAVLLLVADQASALAYACGAQCRAVANRPGLMHKLRAQDEAQAVLQSSLRRSIAFSFCCACSRAGQRLWAVMDTTKVYVPDVWLEALGAHVLLCRWPCRCLRFVASRLGGGDADDSCFARRICPCTSWIISCGLPCFSVVIADVEDEDEYLDAMYAREAPAAPAGGPSARISRPTQTAAQTAAPAVSVAAQPR